MIYSVYYLNKFVRYMSSFDTKEQVLNYYKSHGYNPENITVKQTRLSKKEQYILKNIYYEINHGYTYGEQIDYVPYPYFHDVLYKTFPYNNIGWSHYGSSAEKNNIKSLQWLLLAIFDCKPSEFIKKYQLREN